MAPFIVSLEGNIGSGKSTLMEHLKDHLTYVGSRPVVYVDEPLAQWETIKNKDGVNMLQLFYSDLLDEEYAIYKTWFYHFNTIHMDALIYLECPPEVSMERCTKRNRPGESITLEYMTKVHERHEEWLHNLESRPLLIIENETSSIDDSLFAVEDFLTDMVCPHDEINHFMENIYSSYIFTRLVLGWFIFKVTSWLQIV